jgi:C-8 sterol isomerase
MAPAKPHLTATSKNFAIDKWAIRAILVLVVVVLASWLDSIRVSANP